MRVQRPHLPVLTGLRFFAALHVVVFHLARCGDWRAPAPLQAFIDAGPVAVTLFFVLSGFILTYTYAGRSGEAQPAMPARAVWGARVARVYPVYVLGLALALPLVVGAWKKSGADGAALGVELSRGVAALLLVQAHVPSLALAWNPPAWSVSAEAFFYLLFPLLAPALLRTSRARATAVAAAAWLLSLAASCAYLALDPDALGVVDTTSRAFWLDLLKYAPLARLPEFVIGIVAARFVLNAPGGAQPAAGPGAAFLLAITISVVVATSGRVPYVALHNGLLAPCFAVLIARLAVESGPHVRVLSAPPMQRLGEASYALYILHAPLLVWLSLVLQRAVGRPVLREPLGALAAIVVVVLCARVVFRFVEEPARRRLRRALVPRA